MREQSLCDGMLPLLIDTLERRFVPLGFLGLPGAMRSVFISHPSACQTHSSI